MATYEVVGIGEHRKFFDDNSYRDAVNYATRNNTLHYAGGANVTSLATAAEEMRDTSISFHKNSGKRLRHSVLSFDSRENVTPEKADMYAKQIIQHYAPTNQIIYAVHDDTDNLHIHFVMNQISFQDGHRYEGKKRDYYDFQRHIRAVTHLPVMTPKKHKASNNAK